MAGLEPLLREIYHEKQEAGSMLCGQHALNNLLQGPYFSAADLSALGHSLDSLEAEYDDQNTGFFSVQVMENALKVWGLTLVRWQSEEMRDFHATPYTQLAFILNLESHWFTVRRFGPAHSSALDDPGEGHFFNLNSFCKEPEWVSRLYLGLVLQQSEAEGYSVFAICPVDPSAELPLVRTTADDLAATLPQPSGMSSGTRISTARHIGSSAAGPLSGSIGVPGAEDEDLMLQAALQASLMGDAGFTEGDVPSWLRDQDLASFQRVATPPQQSLLTGSFESHPSALPELPDPHSGLDWAMPAELIGEDPVAASIARSRALLDRTRREQEYAMREGLDEDMNWRSRQLLHTRQLRGAATGALRSLQGQSSLPNVGSSAARPRDLQRDHVVRRTTGQDEEEAMLRRALAETRPTSQDADDLEDPDFQPDEMMDTDSFDDAIARQMEARELAQLEDRIHTRGTQLSGSIAVAHDRLYDDEDAELQAALRASLESAPEGMAFAPMPAAAPGTARVGAGGGDTSGAAATDANQSTDSYEAPPREEALSAEELRKRRLARFS